MLIAILRRCDKDDDGRINYEEFVEAIQPADPTITKQFSTRKYKQGSRSSRALSTDPVGRDSKRSMGNTMEDGFVSPKKYSKSKVRTTTPGKKLSKITSPGGEKKSVKVLTSAKKSAAKSKLNQSFTKAEPYRVNTENTPARRRSTKGNRSTIN